MSSKSIFGCVTKTKAPPFGEELVFGGPGWIRTNDQSVMLTTTTFVASFEFVVWTVSSSLRDVRRSVSTPSWSKTRLGSGLPVKGSPNLTNKYQLIAQLTAL
jgi:hypothetical protein